MTDAPISATLFAYQVGFGDCFLLRFSYADGGRRHMLIDFGTTGLPETVERDQMLKVVRRYLPEEQAQDVLKLVDKLEQDEDVQKVFHNLQ